MSEIKDRLGIICGGTDLPGFMIREAIKSGENPVVVAIMDEADEEIGDLVDDVFWLEIGNVGESINIFKDNNVSRCIMVGRVDHRRIFRNLNFDKNLNDVYQNLKDRKADTLLGAFVNVFKENGLNFIDSTSFLKKSMAPVGNISSQKPKPEQKSQIKFGWYLAKELGKHDIGQSVVVRDNAVIGVEAMEGTDELIKRSMKLCPSGAVLVKVAKPQQDLRFDVPVIGPNTVQNLADIKGSIIAVEADKVIIVNIEKCKSIAEDNNILFIGINEDYLSMED